MVNKCLQWLEKKNPESPALVFDLSMVKKNFFNLKSQYKNIDLSGLLEKDETNKEPHFCTVEKNEPWDQGILAKKILKQSKKF